MRGELLGFTPNRDGTINVTVTVAAEVAQTLETMNGKPLDIEIKRWSPGRSMDANKFLWAMCGDIGKAMTPPISKDEVYRMAIKEAGVWFEKEEPIFFLDKIRRRWESAGVGWFMEVVDNGAPGRKLVRLYFGTSTYTADEIKPVIEWLKDQCEQMQIPIPLSKKEEQRLIERWGQRVTGSSDH